MLAIDVPISVLAGLVLADAGRDMLRSGDRQKHNFVRTVVLLFTLFFVTPIPFYFFMGWPGWEVNYLWQWTDNVRDSPLRSGAVTAGVLFLTVVPSYLAFRFGKLLIRIGAGWLVKVGYILTAILVGGIIFLTRDITFNIASTYSKYKAGEFYSFWSHPFFTGWLIVTTYFWCSLAIFYRWLRRKGRPAKLD